MPENQCFAQFLHCITKSKKKKEKEKKKRERKERKRCGMDCDLELLPCTYDVPHKPQTVTDVIK